MANPQEGLYGDVVRKGPAIAESFDLLVRWPGDRSVADLDRRKTFAIASYPRYWDLRRRTVWVAHDGEVVCRLSIGEVSNAVSNLPIAGAVPSSHGHRLKIRSRSPVKSKHLKDVKGARWPNTFPHPATMRYVRPDPFEVVHVGSQAGERPFRVPVEVSNVESVVVERQDEHVVHFRERRLVRAYQDWLGRPIDSVVIPTTKGALRTDAFDDDRSLLIEAKSNADRPSLRMAVGQLWDYARHLGEPTVAVLLPAKPDREGLAFLDSCSVGAVWQTGTGFREALSGHPLSARS